MIIITFNSLDWLVFSGMMMLALATTMTFRKLANTTKAVDYILMGRALTLPLFIVTLVSSWYGNIFGVTQIAYREGIFNFVTQGIFWYAAYIFFALTMAERINRSRAMTMSETISQVYGPKSGKFASMLILCDSLPISYTIAAGLLLRNVFGMGQDASILCCGALALIYCRRGGLRTVVLSEIPQFITMFIAALMVVCFSLYRFGGIEFLHNRLPPSYFAMSGSRPLGELLLWLCIAFATTITCPLFYQRCLAANSPQVARNGILLSTCCWFVFDCCTTLGGMYAKAVMPNLDPVDAYLVYSLNILPSGLRGLFLSGITAVLLSTIDAMTTVSSNVISYDLLPPRWRQIMWVRPLSVVLVVVLTSAAARTSAGDIERVWIIFKSCSTVLLSIPILWGYFICPRGSDRQFLTTCSISLLLMLCYYVVYPSINRVHAFYIGATASIFILAAFAFINYIYNKRRG